MTNGTINKLSGFLFFIFFNVLIPAAQEVVKVNKFKSSYDGKQLLITVNNGYIKLVPFTDNVVQVTYQQLPKQDVVSYSTVGKPQLVRAAYKDKGAFIELKTAKLTTVVDKRSLAIYFIDLKGDTLSSAQNFQVQDVGSSLDFVINKEEAIYGGGSKALNLNKRGHILENYNQAHYGYRFGESDLNISIPFLVSNRCYGLYIDDFAKSRFDVGKTDNNKVIFTTSSELLRFYFVGGKSMDQVISNYTLLTGKQPLPPRWALGYITSRYGYKSEREVMEVVEKTVQAGIPLDGVVLDLYWYKQANLMGNHSWYLDSFPNPQLMLNTLLKRGIKVVPISETYITEKSENFPQARNKKLLTTSLSNNGQPYIFKRFWAGPAGLLDIFKTEAQQFYWGMYKQRIAEGISGWWFDLGEPELVTDSLVFSWGSNKQVHNLYSLIWAKTAFDGYRKDFPDSRIFTLIRSGYAGMQRYSTFPWSGDISRSFEGLKAQIPVMVNMGLGGIGYMHSDAGGFAGNSRKDPELYSRWLAFAAFTPVMRTHAAGYTPEPIYWDDTTRQRVTRYIKLRYSLLPYNYTLAYLNTTSGRPLMMPVNYFDTKNLKLSDVNDEYLWGEHFLVAPVIAKGETQKRVLFPAGNWIGFADNRVYRDSAVVPAPIDSLPLFVKDGSIIPMVEALSNTEQYHGSSVALNYYTTGNVAEVISQWYYDDGKDPDVLTLKKYDLVTFATHTIANNHVITIKPNHMFHLKKSFLLKVPGNKLVSVKFSRKIVSKVIGNIGVIQSVNFEWDGKPLTINLKTTSL